MLKPYTRKYIADTSDSSTCIDNSGDRHVLHLACYFYTCVLTDHSGDLHSDCLLAGAMSMALCCILYT